MPRLDQHIRAHTGTPRKNVRALLAQGRVMVDGVLASDAAQVIGKFNQVQVDGTPTRATRPCYLMLHKPRGVVCATKDARHRTVIDLLSYPDKEDLHIVGRLDYNSTGLVLLTNDGQWSRSLSLPGSGLLKRYRVGTEQVITQEYIDAFEQGMYFDFEEITTRPAQLKILDERTAEVGLVEGRYHQIKRMFGRFNNKVLSIHRFAVGPYALGDLPAGDFVQVPGDLAPHLASGTP
ncbi:MAG: pseudouridine synthase [Congregibacter sp.]|nr:pseudouridine synthase [Congregibacter sp.]